MRKSMRKACAYDFAKSFLFLDKLQKWIYNFIKIDCGDELQWNIKTEIL